MKLFVNCNNCYEKIIFHNAANDRVELENELGRTIKLDCTSCLKSARYHVNEIEAIERQFIFVAALFIFIVGTLIGFYYVYQHLFHAQNIGVYKAVMGVIMIPSFVYVILNKQEKDNVERFNSYDV